MEGPDPGSPSSLGNLTLDCCITGLENKILFREALQKPCYSTGPVAVYEGNVFKARIRLPIPFGNPDVKEAEQCPSISPFI
jgi:hypothetical protein